MRRRRARVAQGRRATDRADVASHDLCRGPGNLTMAMGITLAENRLDLLADRLYVENRGLAVPAIDWSRRIGINVGVEHPWRASIRDHPAVSGKTGRPSGPKAAGPGPAVPKVGRFKEVR